MEEIKSERIILKARFPSQDPCNEEFIKGKQIGKGTFGKGFSKFYEFTNTKTDKLSMVKIIKK